MDERQGITVGTITHASWSAIFAGSVIAIVIQTTLLLLGLGIGLVSAPGASGTGLGIGAVIWWVIASIIALYFGGWVSGRLAGVQGAWEGVLHGLITWGVFTLVALYFFAATLGAIIGGGLGIVKSTAQISTQAAQAAPGQAQQGISQLQQQAQQAVPQLQQQAQSPQAKEKAAEVGETAAKGAGKGAIGAFFLMLLEGIAAAIGGSVGRTRGPVKV